MTNGGFHGKWVYQRAVALPNARALNGNSVQYIYFQYTSFNESMRSVPFLFEAGLGLDGLDWAPLREGQARQPEVSLQWLCGVWHTGWKGPTQVLEMWLG